MKRFQKNDSVAHQRQRLSFPANMMAKFLLCQFCALVAVVALSFTAVIPTEALIHWPASEDDPKIIEIHAEISKPLRLDCPVAIQNITAISDATKLYMRVWHKNNLAPDHHHQRTVHPIYGIQRRVTTNKTDSSKIMGRTGTWLDPKLKLDGGSVQTDVIRKMTDHVVFIRQNLSSSWNAIATFELEMPGVTDSGTFFGMEVGLRAGAGLMWQKNCVFFLTLYGCPMDLRLEVLNATLPHDNLFRNEKLKAECYYTAFQPGAGRTTALGRATTASEIAVRHKQHDNDSVITSTRRVEELRDRPDLPLAEVPAPHGQWKRHRLVYDFDLGGQSAAMQADAHYEVLCRATVYKDLSRRQRIHATLNSTRTNRTNEIATEIMCFREILKTYPASAVHNDDGGFGAAGVIGIIAACLSVIAILAGLTYGFIRYKNKGYCWSAPQPMRPRRQYISPSSLSSSSCTAADGKPTAPPTMITTASAAERSALHAHTQQQQQQHALQAVQNLITASAFGSGVGAGAIIFPKGSAYEQRPASSSDVPSTQSSPIDMTGDTDSDSIRRHHHRLTTTYGYDTVDRAQRPKLFEQQTTTHSLTRPQYKISGRSGGSYNVPAATVATGVATTPSGQPMMQKQRFRLGSGEVVPFDGDDDDMMAMRSGAVFVRSGGGHAKLSPTEGSKRSSGTSNTNVSSVTTNVVGEI